MKNITIFGTGYVGLVSGTCFAEIGHKVTCVDISPQRIESLNLGRSPIYEPGIEDMILTNMKKSRLSFSMLQDVNIDKSDVIFICVGTPSKKDGSSDLSYVYQCCDDIANLLESKKLIVMKSTVPVGTCLNMTNRINDNLKKLGKKFEVSVLSNPEFLREGNAIFDFMNPDRIIIGCNSDTNKQFFLDLYKPILQSDKCMIFMNKESSELTKYAANTMLALRISFINELSRYSNQVNASIDSIAEGIGTDKRIGKSFLRAGLGYGGSCFPKDVDSLIDQMKSLGQDSQLLNSIKSINSTQPTFYIDKLINLKNSKDQTISLWGFTFKPDTDDFRETPALKIINRYADKVKCIKVYDPFYKSNNPIRDSFDNVIFCTNKFEATLESNLLILVTDWEEFRKIDYKELNNSMKEARVFDGRNILPIPPEYISFSSINNFKKI